MSKNKGIATEFLIIGYGNTLRSDDGIGPRVAETVASWRMPNVRAIASHQLTPEIAEALSRADVAIFVDARASSTEGQLDEGVRFTIIRPVDDASATGASASAHTSDPRNLLALTRNVYGRCPQAWAISVSGVNFEFGETLSKQAQHGVEIALRRIRLVLTGR